MICALVTELSDIPAPVLKDLDTLKVLDWYGVGLQLGIEETELDIIRKNPSDAKEQKREMFRVWLRQTEQPSYLQLARALFIAEETNLGRHVCKKYGECLVRNHPWPEWNVLQSKSLIPSLYRVLI